jgi:hypothetical protein
MGVPNWERCRGLPSGRRIKLQTAGGRGVPGGGGLRALMGVGDAFAEWGLRGEERESQNLQIAWGSRSSRRRGPWALMEMGDALAEWTLRGEGAIPYGRTSLATLNSVLYSATIASMMRVLNGAGRSWCRFLF